MSNTTLQPAVGAQVERGVGPHRADVAALYGWRGSDPESAAVPLYTLASVEAAVAAERERWQRIAEAAQAVTTGCKDRIDTFVVPSHLMAALALALDEGPNIE